MFKFNMFVVLLCSTFGLYAQSTVTLESFDLGGNSFTSGEIVGNDNSKSGEITINDVCGIGMPKKMECPGGAEPVLRNCSYQCPQTVAKGCHFVGEYKRTVVKINSITRCSGPPPRPAILCDASVICKPGSDVHKSDSSYPQSQPINMRGICLADVEGRCPKSVEKCFRDEEVSNYLDHWSGKPGNPVRELKSQRTNGN